MAAKRTVSLLVLTILVFLFTNCESHEHGHDHHGHSHDEAPSFKYSRAANEEAAKKMHDPQTHHTPKSQESVKKDALNNKDLWVHAMGSTLLISAAPFVILFFVPLDNTQQKKPLLNILLAFASGGLLGDAFLHLIPHATMAVAEHEHSHSHSHSHNAGEEGHAHDMSVGLLVLAGIVTFLILEKVVRILKGDHSHSHSHNKPVEKKDDKKDKKKPAADNSKNSKKAVAAAEKRPIKVAGYLNLVADFSHNFTDGLAIGSSYLAGNTIGLVTTFTILLHEVPHEIGDFAILLQSGVSRKNAMLLQLVTALGALAGTALSLFAHNTAITLAMNSSTYILPFTAGGFIYIALVSVLPELLDEEKPSFFQTVLQVLAMLAGVYMMVFIAKFE